MKFILAIIAISTFHTSTVRAEVCAEGEEECIATGKACTGREAECCEGLGCFGFNFYKTCQAMPTCHGEWHDCKNAIPCCDGFTCAETPTGMFECQTPKIGTRSVEITTGLIIAEPIPPPPPPTRNLKTTTKQTNAILKACLSGDPHIDTYDGLNYDCQGHGEFILSRSLVTQREFQGRFKQIPGQKVSIMKGIVVQDEGDTPKVQITAPETEAGYSQDFGTFKCPLQLFVDDVQQDLFNYDDAKVKIELLSNGQLIQVSYKTSGMKVELRVGGGDRCTMNACFIMPDTDDQMVGLLGSPDGQVNNEWMSKNGTVVPGATRNGKGAYDYCVSNWCIRDAEDSMFFYNQLGADFAFFTRCDLAYGGVVEEEVLEKVTPEIEGACGEDIACIEDAVFGGIEMARDGRNTRMTRMDVVVKEGADCKNAKCSTDCKCRNDGLAGSRCVKIAEAEPKVQTRHLGWCSDRFPCGEGLQCVKRRDGKGSCQKIGACSELNGKCTTNADCCTGTSCLGATGAKKCLQVGTKATGGTCMPQGSKCSFGVDCCDGTRCIKEEDSYTCLALPECWDEPFRNCDPADGMPGCCAGFECTEDTSSFTKKARGNCGKSNNAVQKVSKVCKPKLTCAAMYGDCTTLPCCGNTGGELLCVAEGDKKVCLPQKTSNTTATDTTPKSGTSSTTTTTSTSTTTTTATSTITSTTPVTTTTGPVPNTSTQAIPSGYKFLSDMWNAGDKDKTSGFAVPCKAYTKVDCSARTVCIRVHAQAGYTIDAKEAWLKDYNYGSSNKYETSGSITWLPNKTGWQQCFKIPRGISATRRSIEIHASWNGSSTASTGKKSCAGDARDKTISMTLCS